MKPILLTSLSPQDEPVISSQSSTETSSPCHYMTSSPRKDMTSSPGHDELPPSTDRWEAQDYFDKMKTLDNVYECLFSYNSKMDDGIVLRYNSRSPSLKGHLYIFKGFQLSHHIIITRSFPP